MIRRVHGEFLVGVLYGQRALAEQGLNARGYEVYARSTGPASETFARLGRTALLFERVIMGTREEADHALRHTRETHRAVSPSAALFAPRGI